MLRLLVLVLICTQFLFSSEIDPVFTSQRSFTSAVVKSLGDAGIAYPTGLHAGLLNPALVNVYRNNLKEIHGSVYAGYGRDSVYNRMIIPFGVSYSSQDGSAAFFYRYCSSDNFLIHQDFIINLSGLLFPSSDTQGAVEFGMNVRYEFMNWKRRPLQPLPVIIKHKDTLNPHLSDTNIAATPITLNGHQRQSNLIFDLGFYQESIMANVDFGLTLKNITGYSWSSRKPKLRSVQDTLHSDTTILDSSYYVGEFEKSKHWISSRYRTLSVGVVYHIPVKKGSFHLALPLDMEVLGLFNKKMNNTFAFKGGVDALIANRFSLRFGYSYAPGILLKGVSKAKNFNFFTGGGGIRIEPFAFDFYITHNTFGTTLMFDY